MTSSIPESKGPIHNGDTIGSPIRSYYALKWPDMALALGVSKQALVVSYSPITHSEDPSITLRGYQGFRRLY